MYRHLAESIKETNNRQFLSLAEVTKYENEYPEKFVNRADVYDKKNIDTIVEELNSTTLSVSGSNLSIPNTIEGRALDLTIEGNTVQNPNNLEDIKSVGMPLPDGNFTFGFKTVGKNLFNTEDLELIGKYYYFEQGYLGPGFASSNPDFNTYIVRVQPKTKYTVSYVNNSTDEQPCSNLTFWTKDLKYLHGQASVKTFTTPADCHYIRFAVHIDVHSVQVELGDTATEYEKYTESVCNIKLPCQLEGLYDIADRLVKNNGVWQIEKYIRTLNVSGQSNEIFYGTERGYNSWRKFCSETHTAFYLSLTQSYGFADYPEMPFYFKKSRINYMCNKFKNSELIELGEGNREYSIFLPEIKEECCFVKYAQPNYLAFKLEKSKFGDYDANILNVTESEAQANFRKYFNENPTMVKIGMANPEIIELPRETQIALNTFNKGTTVFTINTEVEPTISCSVSKSIGSETNMLHSQLDGIIDSINEIETISKGNILEYSNTNGDMYLENTNNGIVEEISIKGKTLVNAVRNGYNDKDAYYQLFGEVLDDGYVKLTYDYIVPGHSYGTKADRRAFRHKKDTIIKPDTEYTIIVDILECTIANVGSNEVLMMIVSNPQDVCKDESSFLGDWQLYTPDCVSGKRYAKVFKTKPKEDFDKSLYGIRTYLRYIEGATGHITYRILVIEGDHTANPPSYFEGVKSVGELSNGISIESRNESGNLFDINNFTKMTYSYNLPIECPNTQATYNIIDDEIHIYMQVDRGETTINKGVGGTYKVKKNTDYTIEYDYASCRNSKLFRIFVVGLYNHEVFDPIPYHTNSDYKYNNRIFTNEFSSGQSGTLTVNSRDFDYLRIFIGGRWYENPTENRYIILKGVSIRESKYARNMKHESSSNKIIAKDNDGNYFVVDALRSTGRVKDEILKNSDGKYYLHKRCGTMTLNGTDQSWRLVIPEYQPSNTDLIAFSCNLDEELIEFDKYNNLPVNDRFLTLSSEISMICESIKYHSTDKTLMVAILKSRLNTLNVAGFMEWVRNNPIEVVYEKAEEIYEIVNINGVNLYECETNVYAKAYPFKPSMKIKTNQYIGNIIDNLNNRISHIEKSIIDQLIYQNRVMMTNMYSADKSNLKVNLMTTSTLEENTNVDYTLFKLLETNLLSDRDSLDIRLVEEIVDFYTMIGKLDFDMADYLLSLI